MTYSEDFLALVDLYDAQTIEFDALKPVSLAVWILESGRGTSGLARHHRNFAGMKYRSEIAQYAKRVLYEAHDGSGYYCEFASLEDFIAGYWAFLDRAPYDGWRAFGSDPEGFISHVGPVWAEDPNYVDKVLRLIPEAAGLLAGAGDQTPADTEPATGPILIPGRPTISLSADGSIATGGEGMEIIYRGDASSPYGRSATRNKLPFAAIVLHHTSPTHTTEWYIQYQIDGDPGRGGHHFGYHFYIAPDGAIYQGAPLTKRTNHVDPTATVRRDLGRMAINNNAIGITASGAGTANGYAPTQDQLDAQEKLVFALCDIYKIPFAHVFGHGEIQTNRHKTEGRDPAQAIRDWGA